MKDQIRRELLSAIANALAEQRSYNNMLSINKDGSWYIGGECGLVGDKKNEGDTFDDLIERVGLATEE